MLIPNKHIETALQRVKDIRETYSLICPQGGTHSIKSVSFLRDAVASAIDGNLTVLELELAYTSASAARGFFLVDGASNYTIGILSKQNTCWQRLVQCKELFHVLLDCDESRNIFIAEHLDDWVFAGPDESDVPTKGVISEFQAEFAAMEFLFPYVDREAILTKNYVSLDVANQYMIPKFMVEKYLSERHMKNMREIVAGT